uniref:Uncharacterized protein n=1 Tax=Populus trichocarpa TaxID=3694 RepID=A0A3N7G7K4_POPTR
MVLSMEPHFLLLSNEGQDRFGFDTLKRLGDRALSIQG